MVVVPDMLSEVVFPFEAFRSSIFLAVSAWEALGVLSMGPFVPVIRVQAREPLPAAVMVAGERIVACVGGVQCYFVLALANKHAFIACGNILMYGSQMYLVILFSGEPKPAGMYYTFLNWVVRQRVELVY
jgi:hypothetical protein